MVSSQTKIRVRYADTDQMKMVYYANYFVYFEEGRSDFLRQMGLSYPEIERMGYYLPVVEAHAEYKKPARYDDLLSIDVMVHDVPAARIRITYEVRNDESNELLAGGHTVHSFVDAATGKPVRAPAKIVELFAKALDKI